MSVTRQRGRHRAPVRPRGWAPRALLSAATAPLGVALGLGAAVVAAVVDRPGLAVVGVVLAGAPALFHAARATALDRELRGRRAACHVADRHVTVAAPAHVDRLSLVKVASPVSLVKPVSLVRPSLVRPVSLVKVPTPAVVRAEAAALQRIWDLGDGPDTGPVPAVPAGPARASAPPSQPLVVDVTDSGLAQVPVPVAFAARPVQARRPRVGTTEARVYDALAHAEADELTAVLEGPGRRGRHAAEAVYDSPPRTGPTSAIGNPRSITPRRGRHAA